MKNGFLKPRLVSKRFDDHGIPLEVLKDFAALEELLDLRAGWLDGQGSAFGPARPRWLVTEIESRHGSDLSLPYLFPTPEGEVQAEWNFAIEKTAQYWVTLGVCAWLALHECRVIKKLYKLMPTWP